MLFVKKKKKSRSRRQVPLEEKQRRKADKLFLDRIKEDPKLADLYIQGFLGITIPKPDPVEEAETKLKIAIIDRVIKAIKENPEIARRISVAKIEEIAGIRVDQKDEEEYDSKGYSRSSLGRLLRSLHEHEEIKELLGIGHSHGFLGMNPQTIAQLILSSLQAAGLARGIEGVKQVTGETNTNSLSPSPTYVAMVDGQEKELTEAQYKALLKEGKVKPVAVSNDEQLSQGQEKLPGISDEDASQPDKTRNNETAS